MAEPALLPDLRLDDTSFKEVGSAFEKDDGLPLFLDEVALSLPPHEIRSNIDSSSIKSISIFIDIEFFRSNF